MKIRSSNSLMTVVAHPDDEVLGCGGTVHRLISNGWKAHLTIMSGGVGGRYSRSEAAGAIAGKQKNALVEQMQKAASAIGYHGVDVFDFPDNRMDTVGRMDLSQAIRPILERERPDLVFTHHPGDYNWDHTAVFDAVMMAARCNPPDFYPAEIRSFEVLSSTERAWQDSSRIFCPNLYVDISKTIDMKKLAMRYYELEYRAYPHPRSIEAIEFLARRRGNEVGMIYAEAFHIIRALER
jgi:LmbE family N-acetylglucosaminyl deacetylase